MFAGNPLGTPHAPPTTRPGSRTTQVGPRSWRSRWVRPAPLQPAEAEAVSTSSGEATAPAAAAEPTAPPAPRVLPPPAAAPQPQQAASVLQGQRAGTVAADSRARPVTRTLLPSTLRSWAVRSCPQCGGASSIPSTHGPLPCTACQPWRRRPDYKPEATLITSQDLDLAQLELAPSSSSSSSSSTGAAPAKRVGRPSKARFAAAAAAAAAPEAAAAPKVSKWHVMTEEKREAIRRGRANKGPHSEEHRRKISRALREAHAKDPGLRHVTRGAKKTCSYCGSEGHTRRGCAKLKADTAAQQAANGEVAPAEGPQRRKRGPQQMTEERKRQLRELLRELHAKNPELRFVGKGKPKTCSYCGGKGHTVRGCEQRKADEAQAAGLPVGELLAGGKAKAGKQRRPPTCGLCGQLGHNKRHCPQQAAAGAAAPAAAAAEAGVADATGTAAGASQPAAAAAAPAQLSAPLAAGPTQHAVPAVAEGSDTAATVPLAPAPLASKGPASASAAAAAPAAEVLGARASPSSQALGSGAAGAAAAGGAAAASLLPEGSSMAGPQVLWQLGAELRPPAQALQEAPASKPAEVQRKGQGPAADGEAQAAGQQRASLAASVPAAPSAATAGKAVLAPLKGADASVAATPSAAAGADSAAASAVRAAAYAAAEQSSAALAAAPAQPAADVQQQAPVQQPQQQQQQQGRMPRIPVTPPPQAPAAANAASSFSSAAASVSYDDAALPTRELGRSGMLLDPDGGLVFPLPTRQSDCILQAAQAVLRAWEDDVRCQCLELPLPLNNPAALEGGGWPGGIRQQYRVALPILEGLLRRLKSFEGLQGRITAEWLDKADCVGAWQSERLAAVLFPTADTLPAVRRIENALSGRRLMLVVNPQWQVEGQVISDFGFGQARRRAEQFIKSFDDVYCLRRARVRGEEVRILRCYPGNWQVYYVKGAGEEPLLLACEEAKPTYQRLEELMQPILARKSSWLQQWLGWAGGGDATEALPPAPPAASRDTGSSDPAARPLPGSSETQRGTRAAAAAGWAADRPPGAAADVPVRVARQQQQRRRRRLQHNAAASAPAQQPGSSDGMGSAEMIPASLSLDLEESLGSISVDPLGSMDIDVITGEPVARDYRLQPVQQIAKWVFGEEGGSAAKK